MKIRANDLVKEYGGRIVVDHVSLEVAQGALLACSVKMAPARQQPFI